jgi:hypothetical protein
METRAAWRTPVTGNDQGTFGEWPYGLPLVCGGTEDAAAHHSREAAGSMPSSRVSAFHPPVMGRFRSSERALERPPSPTQRRCTQHLGLGIDWPHNESVDHEPRHVDPVRANPSSAPSRSTSRDTSGISPVGVTGEFA